MTPALTGEFPILVEVTIYVKNKKNAFSSIKLYPYTFPFGIWNRALPYG